MSTSFTLLPDPGADQRELLRTIALVTARIRPLPTEPGEATLVGPGPNGPLTAWLAGRGGLQRLDNEVLLEYRSRWQADHFAVITPDPEGGDGHAAIIAAVVGDHRSVMAMDTYCAFGRIGDRIHKTPANRIAYPDGSWLLPISLMEIDPDELYRIAQLTLFSLGSNFARQHMRRRTAGEPKPGHPSAG